MTFDLFGDEPPAAPPAPAIASYMMQPTGEPNRWRYRGVELACDMKLQGLLGHWHTVEPLGQAIAQSDRRVLLCKAIDAYLGTPQT